MIEFTKLATYLDSFEKDNPNYDIARYIKTKISQDLANPEAIHNGGEESLSDNDVTMSTPEQQTNSNHEGQHMQGAFKELDAQNEIQKQKEEIQTPGRPEEKKTDAFIDMAGTADFGTNTANQKVATLYSHLVTRLKK